jgi:hypothetical protein
MRKPRDLSARIVLMNDVALRGLHQFRLGAGHRLQRGIAIAALDRLFDGADRAAHLGAARLIDNRAAGNLARRLLGGSCVGHALKYPSAVTDRGWSGLERAGRSTLVIDAGVFSGVPENAMVGANMLTDGAAQRTAAAGLPPPPLASL